MPDLVTAVMIEVAGVFVFRLEVRGQDAEFLDRQLRERVAAADVLADDTALLQVGLQADAVDEDVDLRTAGDLAVTVCADTAPANVCRNSVWFTLDARCERREIEEVAVVLRQVFDLVAADVGRDFRGLGFDQAPSGDDDRSACAGRGPGRWRRGGRAEVKGRGFANPDGYALAARARPALML